MALIDLDKWKDIISALKKNKLRTFLTAFGVFWGIFMLMIMLGSGNGLQNGVTHGFKNFATNSAFIWSQSTTMAYKGFRRGRSIELTNDDMVALKQNIEGIDILAPRINGWSSDEGNNVMYGEKSGSFNIKGDYPEYQFIDPAIITAGRFLNPIDIRDKRKVAVVGQRILEVLFEPGEDPIGKYIKIHGVYFQVIGAFKPLNPNINFGGSKEETIYIPFSTLQKTYNFGNQVHYFSVTAREGIPVSEVEEACINLLQQRHKIHPDDEQAFGHFNIEEEFGKINGLFTGISGLIWIVGIGTLLAGVIGVSNIMLVIVKERTKEIGIMRAIGATPRNIIIQIITESVFLTTLAGYLGLVFGVLVVEGINALISGGPEPPEMFRNPQIDFSIAVTALVILIVSGALAGLIPAKRAVSIKPIDALRAE